jgi:transcriptional regulator NrdR family protein
LSKLSPSDVKQERFMTLETLDEKLRFMVLLKYGLSKAIKDNTISDTDLKLIQKSVDNKLIQREIDNILQNRTHKKVVEKIKKYKRVQHLNGFAAARARLQYKNELQALFGSEKYVSDLDKQEMGKTLTK